MSSSPRSRDAVPHAFWNRYRVDGVRVRALDDGGILKIERLDRYHTGTTGDACVVRAWSDMGSARGKGGGMTVRFGRAGLVAGACRTVPVAIGVASYGLVFGVLARQAGLSVVEVAAMSGLVFAGSAQLVALGLWAATPPFGPLLLTTLIVNLRLVLMGAALTPWFGRLSPLRAYTSLFFMADENWALTMRAFTDGEQDAAFLLGGGLVLYLAWLSSSLAGRLLGATLGDPARLGLDVAFTTVFLALLTGLWRGWHDLLPWITAAAVAILTAAWLPGRWYILLGGLTGAAVGALQPGADATAGTGRSNADPKPAAGTEIGQRSPDADATAVGTLQPGTGTDAAISRPTAGVVNGAQETLQPGPDVGAPRAMRSESDADGGAGPDPDVDREHNHGR